VNAVLSPPAIGGPCLTIRRFTQGVYTADRMIAAGTLSQDMVEYLKDSVLKRQNIVVCGGTGSGKTTTLKLLASFIPDAERIVTVEDAAELQLSAKNIIALEARTANQEGSGEIRIRDLVRNALRMRPDRIVVGECRGGEALDMLQAMNTGHEGSLTTVHANTPRDALYRLEVMVLMSGFDLPVAVIRDQIQSAISLIVHQQRCADGVRRVVRVEEVSGIESGVVQLQPVYEWTGSAFRSAEWPWNEGERHA
jgi:pilus assembly protein CpaF